MSWTPSEWAVDPGALFDLSDRTAIVTGGASGLGRAIALGFGARGADVVVADLNLDGAEAVADRIGANAIAEPVDVTDDESLQSLRDATETAFGSYEVVCNLPGKNVREPALDLSEADWRDVIDLNLTGMFLGAKVLGRPLVEKGGGSMINMASVRGIVGGNAQSAYSASKGGVIQLTRVLAAEWAPAVRVNAIAPGYMKTPLVREAMTDDGWYDSMREKHLLDRFGEPEEIVGAAIFLAGPASSFVTGSVLTVDGGWTAH